MTSTIKTTPALLVTLDHGEIWTTSLLVAEKFAKRHADVMRAVQNLECSPAFAERNFALSEYRDPTGRTHPGWPMPAAVRDHHHEAEQVALEASPVVAPVGVPSP